MDCSVEEAMSNTDCSTERDDDHLLFDNQETVDDHDDKFFSESSVDNFEVERWSEKIVPVSESVPVYVCQEKKCRSSIGTAVEKEGCGGVNEYGGGKGFMVRMITRPKGGKRCLCMDLNEIKACRDLGFQLEHHQLLMFQTEMSKRNNNNDASWRISNPGDDPRDVKARLKVWAQAVALASTS